MQFDDSPGQQETCEALAEFMKFETPVTIPVASITRLTMDAPAGLGGEFQRGTLTLDGTFPAGSEQAAILLRVPARSAGGLRLSAQDPAGLLTLEQRFDMVQRTHQARLTWVCDTFVGVLGKSRLAR